MSKHDHGSTKSGFRHFFFRGLAILLPSLLTIWILFVVYQFVQEKIAGPINSGIRAGIVQFTPFPMVVESQIEAEKRRVEADPSIESRKNDRAFLRHRARERLLHDIWFGKYQFAFDLIGLVVAIFLIYIAGAILGSFIGRRLYARGEELIAKVPLIKQVYPSVKQVTDFLVGSGDEKKRMKFNRVVAVEYPRKGLWSIGLVTGNTLQKIQDYAGQPCLTVFVPSSPTPFTGYVITIPAGDAIDLPITIEEALRFSVSGGVIVPPSQLIESGKDESPMAPEQRASA